MEKVMLNMVNKKKISQHETSAGFVRTVLYLTGFTFIFAGYFLQSTMFPEMFHFVSAAISPLRILGAAFVLISLLTKKRYRLSFLIFSGILIAVSILVRHYSTVNLTYVMLLIIGASGVKYDSVVKLYVFLKAIGIFFTIGGCLAGIIPNLTYLRDDSFRQAFGFIYPTDFAAHLTFLYLAISYLRRSSFKWLDVLFGIVIAFFQFHFCQARLDSSLVLLAVFLYYLLRSNSRIKENLLARLDKPFEVILYFLVPLLFIFTFLLPKIYVNGNSLVIWLDTVLSGRIHLVAEGMQKYPFTLFGQQVITNGFGGLQGKESDRNIYGYFMLDSSYAIIALTYGLVMSVIVIFIFWKSIKRAAHSNNVYMLISLLVVLIHCFVAQFCLDPSYNIFLLICFSQVPRTVFAEHKLKPQHSA